MGSYYSRHVGARNRVRFWAAAYRGGDTIVRVVVELLTLA
jgi:hypothetical protein